MFTKGKWVARKILNYKGTPDEEEVWDVCAEDPTGSTHVAECGPTKSARCRDDASLISAAPNMLKALKYIGCIGKFTCCKETPCWVCSAINKAMGKKT